MPQEVPDIRLNFHFGRRRAAIDSEHGGAVTFTTREARTPSVRFAHLPLHSRLIVAPQIKGGDLAGILSEFAQELRTQRDTACQQLSEGFREVITALSRRMRSTAPDALADGIRIPNEQIECDSNELRRRMVDLLRFFAHQHSTWGRRIDQAVLEHAMLCITGDGRGDAYRAALAPLSHELSAPGTLVDYDRRAIARCAAEITNDRGLHRRIRGEIKSAPSAKDISAVVSSLVQITGSSLLLPTVDIDNETRLPEGTIMAVGSSRNGNPVLHTNLPSLGKHHLSWPLAIFASLHEIRHITQHTLAQKGREAWSLGGELNGERLTGAYFLIGEELYVTPAGDAPYVVELPSKEARRAGHAQYIRYVSGILERDADAFPTLLFRACGATVPDEASRDTNKELRERDYWFIEQVRQQMSSQGAKAPKFRPKGKKPPPDNNRDGPNSLE